MTLPKVIFVDWDGTLSVSKFWHHWLDEDLKNYNKIQQALFVERPEMLREWMRGYVSAERIVREIARHTDLDYQYLMTALEKSCKSMTFIDAQVLDVIREKRERGMKVIIATDNMDTFTRWTVPSLKLNDHFDGILTSAKRSALKSEVSEEGVSLFFHHYLAQNAIKPIESLLIDDRDWSVMTRRIGMQFMQVTPAFSVIKALQTV